MAPPVMLDAPAWPPVASTSKSTPPSCLPLSRTFSSTKASTAALSSKTSKATQCAATQDVQAAPSKLQPNRRGLESSQMAALSLYLKQKRSIVKLRISDIAGTIDEEGNAVPPAVKRGRIPAVVPGSAGVPCCLIGRLPFERCEIVAMVVKKNVLYNTRREYLPATEKGKERATEAGSGGQGYVETDERGRMYINRTEVGKIFYDFDDESGATIACQINPAKVYAAQLVAHRAALKAHEANSSHISPTGTESTEPRSDPRLWIYRYKEPPRPPIKRIQRVSKTYEPPIYTEGTLVRAICKIVNNYKSGDRMLEAISMEAIDVRANGGKGKYAEWHHAREAIRLQREVYSNREEVGKILRRQDLAGSADHSSLGHVKIASMDDTTEVASSSQDSMMYEDSQSMGITSTLMDVTAYNVSASMSCSMSGSRSSTKKGSKGGKLPSLRRIAEQKLPVSRQLFFLYVKEHFRKLQREGSSAVLPAISSDAPGAILGEQQNRLRTITSAELRADRALDWLATTCAKAEASTEAGLSSSSASQASKVEASIITSSPVKHLTGKDLKKRPKLRAEYVEAKKGELFSWVIQTMFKEGVIFVHPPGTLSLPSASEDVQNTPRASKIRRTCLCSKDGNARNLAKSPSCACTKSTSARQQVESYSLITPDSLLPALEPIFVRLAAVAAPNSVHPDALLGALKRKDEMFMHIQRETIEEAMDLL